MYFYSVFHSSASRARTAREQFFYAAPSSQNQEVDGEGVNE